ncbi:MAG TPA: hypothetical protein VFT48_06580, partial [Pyrinomonadaceae bacterium]|nr:hypothetical protein [Pyrinomonadaceae bacterium]
HISRPRPLIAQPVPAVFSKFFGMLRLRLRGISQPDRNFPHVSRANAKSAKGAEYESQGQVRREAAHVAPG